MTRILYLNARHSLIADPAADTDAELHRRLKQQYGTDARRLSRLCRLVLLGALPLRDRLAANTEILLASPFSSPAKFGAVFAKLTDGNLPAPLDFIANLHNAPVFQLAQSCGITGGSAFLPADADSYAVPLILAASALITDGARNVLVGWAYENQQRGETDGSIWWLLGSRPERSCTHTLHLHPPACRLPPPAPDGGTGRGAGRFFPAVCTMQHALDTEGRLHHPPQGLCPAFDIRPFAQAPVGHL